MAFLLEENDRVHTVRRRLLGALLMLTGAAGLISCDPGPELGPVDGFDLPPTDLERVAVGSEAPDFTLRSSTDDLVTLSDYRGSKDVVLVFYRGHW